MFQVAEFARLTRVSVRALRQYDEAGLLVPVQVHAATGEDGYTTAHLPRLNRIEVLRALGLGLTEIAELLDAGDPAVDRVVAEHEQRLVDEIAQANSRLRLLRALRTLLADTDDLPEVEVRPVPSLLVAARSAPAGEDVTGLLAEVEAYVAGHRARSNRPPLALLADPDDETVTVAVPLARPVPPDGRLEVGFLDPEPRMACLVHHGDPARLGHVLQRMLRWLEHTGQRPGGPVRQVYLRMGPQPAGRPPRQRGDAPAAAVTELQVPLRPAGMRPEGTHPGTGPTTPGPRRAPVRSTS